VVSWHWWAIGAVLVRPGLWWVAVRQLFRLARRGWWRRWPLLPLPDADYLAFRLTTQYGDPDHVPEARDVITYLEWCRANRRSLP
jgi:hypothetical protein